MKKIYILFFLTFFAINYSVAQQAGTLDSSFGTGGFSIMPNISGTNSMVLQPDGKILVAGSGVTGGSGKIISRSNSNGSIDSAFGVNGYATIPQIGSTGSPYYDRFYSLALQPDGKIIAVGESDAHTSKYHFVTVRYNANGIIDSTFGNNGVVVTANPGYNCSATRAIVQSDGKIVVAGWTAIPGLWQSFLTIRYDSSGAVDTTFGIGGMVITTPRQSFHYVSAMVINPAGKILISGYAQGTLDYAFEILQYDSTGTLDSTFATGGIDTIRMVTAGNVPAEAHDLKLLPNGKILVTGYSYIYGSNDVYQFATIRLNSDGTLDNTFGSNGKAFTNFAISNNFVEDNEATSIAIQTDGKIIISGYVTDDTGSVNTGYDFAMVRYTINGLPDNTFGPGGKRITALSGTEYSCSSALQPDGKLLLAGTADGDRVIARYFTGQSLGNVWPGDANEDLTANNFDLLTLGLHYGTTGPARAAVSNAWTNYYCNDWQGIQQNGSNVKYADCNGDGIINMSDTLAINLNYNSSHTYRLQSQQNINTAPDLHFVPSATAVAPGAWVDIDVSVSNAANPIDLYGIAFNIGYDASLVQLGTVSIDYPSSWLGASGINAITIANTSANAEGAITRINHSNVNGFGKIATLRFQTLPSVNVLSQLNLDFINYKGYDALGNLITFNLISDSIIIDPLLNIISVEHHSFFNLFPNPVNANSLQITLSDVTEEKTVMTITDAIGKTILSQELTNTNTTIQTSNFSNGVYFVTVIGGKINETKKFVKE